MHLFKCTLPFIDALGEGGVVYRTPTLLTKKLLTKKVKVLSPRPEKSRKRPLGARLAPKTKKVTPWAQICAPKARLGPPWALEETYFWFFEPFMAVLDPGTYQNGSGAKFCSRLAPPDFKLVYSGPYWTIFGVPDWSQDQTPTSWDRAWLA